MLQIHDIRESRVYQDALQEGREEGRDLGLKEERRNTIMKLASRKMTAEQIAAMLELDLEEVSLMMNLGRPGQFQ